MKYIRIHNDLHFAWRFFVRGEETPTEYNLEGRDIKVVITSPFGVEYVPAFTVQGNEARFSFYGKDQNDLGEYTLTMYENEWNMGMRAIDKICPFRLVAEQETVIKTVQGACEFPTLDIETIELSSEFDYTRGGVTTYDELPDKPSINGVVLVGDKTGKDLGLVHPYISLERKREYFYRVTFDALPEDDGGESPIVGGCSSFVADGELHTNLDWGYDNTLGFDVRTRAFEGESFIGGLDEGNLNDEQIAQLPYRVHRGINNHGIKLATHVLFNDWHWTGCGQRSISLTRLPFLVLSRVKSMATIATDLDGVLGNLYAPEGLAALDYLVQIIVTDGVTTYAIMPPLAEGQGYVLQNISSNPKMTNFRWVNRAIVSRSDPDLQERPTGIERWNAMPCPLEDLRFTKAYEQPTRLSEFIGLRGTTKDSTDAQLEAIYTDARAEYLTRQRDGKTWQTMESAVYGSKLESLWIQENWDDDIIGASGEIEKGLEKFKGELPAFISGEGFIKNTVSDLANYYLKTETYSKTEVDTIVAAIKQFTYEVVASLPLASASTMHKIYLVPAEREGASNVKDEYITIDNGASASTRYTWEKIGSTEIDLSNYPTTVEMNAAIAAAVAPYKTEAQIRSIITSYIRGFFINGELVLELSDKLRYDSQQKTIFITSISASYDETNQKIII